MMKQRWLAVFALGVFAGPLRAQSPAAAIAFTNVTIIDTSGGPARAAMTVVVRGQRIAQVGPTAGVTIPRGVRVVDATGKFLIPGLWDMHAHSLWVPGGKEVTLPLFLANGITGVRDMGSELGPILAARREIANGTLPGPRLVVAGPMLDGPTSHYAAAIAVGTPQEGRRAVKLLKSRGVDFIKVQSGVPREAFFAIADECRKQRLTFVGHVPDAIRASEAASAGQRSFEHLIGIFEASSTVEDELLKGPKSPGRFLETYAPARETAIIELLARLKIWQCPTLVWERGQWLVDAIDVTKDPDLKYAPRSWLEKVWPKSTAGILKELDTDPLPVRQRFVEHELDIVRKLHQAGVPFLAGTDTAAGVDVLPGFSLHLELELFVAAGFTPLEALQTATINPARFLGRTNDFGTVEKGRVADLVLLDGDPLVDIRNAGRIDAVVANGRHYPRAELSRILAQVEAYAKTH